MSIIIIFFLSFIIIIFFFLLFRLSDSACADEEQTFLAGVRQLQNFLGQDELVRTVRGAGGPD